METLIKDIRYGLRGLIKQPGFSAIVVITLALGIGANTAIFSLINTVLLKPLPYQNPDRLVMVWEEASFAGFPRNTPAPANFADWRAQNQVFEEMAALASRSFNLTGEGEAEKLQAYAVTSNFFSLLGVQPIRGRGLLADDDQPEASKVAVLSYGLWQRRFGGADSIVGKEILLNGEKYSVVGVMPPGFQFLENYINLWVPIAFTPAELADRGAHYLNVVARMKTGVTLNQALTDIQTLTRRIAQDHPDEAGRLDGYVVPLRDQLAGDVRRPLLVLLVAVGLVLLIACANVANLLLSRAIHRRKEIAVRAALGAGRLRILRQLLTESLLLALISATLGVLIASWSLGFLRQLIPAGMTSLTRLELDLPVLAATLLISVLTGVLFGLAPALKVSQLDLNLELKQGRGRNGMNSGGNLRNALVIAEISMALVLLIAAGLLLKTFFKLQEQYSGLYPKNVLTLRTQLPPGKYADHAKRGSFYHEVLERVRTLPGVISAGYTTTIPLEWKGGTSGFYPEGLSLDQARAGGLSYDANHRQVTADYLRTMGIPLRQGRYFSQRDNEQAMRVAIINETMARQYWPGQNAVGKRFQLGDPEDSKPWLTIVGVAGDVRQMGIAAPVKAEMYLPERQTTGPSFFAPRDLVVRTKGDPLSLVASVRREIQAVDPDQPVSNVRTMAEVLAEETGQRRLGALLLLTFAGLALILACIGIYGVLSYAVVQSTQEIGVRLALGARPRDVLSLIVSRGMKLALIGVAIGLMTAFGLTRLMSGLLFGVTPTDGTTFLIVPVILLGIAFFACYVPARRATKVDPLMALRYE